jgi:glycosyltransferase involved in cell wall biosynthesis
MSSAPISAVVPAHEAAAHLPAALESVHAQTTGVSEVVVVDDGSSDDTAAVAEEHGARVVRHPANRGVSAARNTGIREARNDWIALLDADDTWKPGKIERQYDLVRRHRDLRVVFSDREHVRGAEVVLPRFLPTHEPYRRVEKEPLGDAAYRLDKASLGRALFPGNFLKPSTLLLRRDLFEAVGGFDERFAAPGSPIGTCEDQDLSLRLVVHTEPAVVEEPLVRYRLRDDSLSSDEIGVKLGCAYLADKVMASPDRYPDGAERYFRRRKPVVLRQAAVRRMHDGSFGDAASLLRRSLRSGVTWRALAAFVVCLLGEDVFSALLALKRRLGLPGIG